MSINKYLIIILLTLLFPACGLCQSPIANRVKARAARLKSNESAIAKYTDDRRHCLYYLRSNRIFKYDAVSGVSSEIVFCQDGYDSIIRTWLSKDGNTIFVLVDRSSLTSQPLVDGQEVLRGKQVRSQVGSAAP